MLWLTACSSKTDRMVGEWSWNDGSNTEYLSDGTFASSQGWSGKWAVKDNVLTINAPLGINVSFEIEEVTGSTVKLRQLGNNKELVGTRRK